jgi:osmoprotectant transport system permease protein
MQYLFTHLDNAWALTIIHLRLSMVPMLLGLLIAVPLGAFVQRTTILRRVTTVTSSIIFTIPSLALFVVLPLIIPTRILDEANVIVALTLYTTALLVRAVPEALDAVPGQVRDAATAVGYRPLTRMLKVDLPLSIPVLVASLRVIAVTNISMVSVGSVIGIGGLGTWFTEGYQADKSNQIVAGIIAIFVLAVVVDTVIMAAGRLATPWMSARAKTNRWMSGRAMNFLQQALSYIFTAANWGGSAGLMARTLEHLQYTAVAVAFSAVIAIPVGMVVGHTGRGTFLVVTGVNALRALPTLGVLLLGVLLWGLGLLPPTVALMLLGVPPLLAGTYAGIANVDPTVVDAARAMGMNQTRVLLRVELPNALPLILGGLRTATLQVVATATIAAYASLGGLGRYLIDGIKVRQFYIALVGALMVTALALILDALLALAVWSSVPGTGRLQRMPEPLIDDEASLSQMRRTSPTGDARGDPSLTVDG